MTRPLVGILVGGASRRMGGVAKGLLSLEETAGETIVGRLLRLTREEGLEVLLVGASTAYEALATARIDDAQKDAGPLAGVVALLAHARREGSARDVIALACDLPAIERSVLHKLVNAPPATATAPRVDGRWQPLVARYASATHEEAAARLASGRHAMHALLDAVSATELRLDAHERASLFDWDSPGDVAASRAPR